MTEVLQTTHLVILESKPFSHKHKCPHIYETHKYFHLSKHITHF